MLKIILFISLYFNIIMYFLYHILNFIFNVNNIKKLDIRQGKQYNVSVLT